MHYPSVWTSPIDLFVNRLMDSASPQSYPLFELSADETTITLTTDLPGFKQDEVEILFDQGKRLTVEAKKKDGRQVRRVVALPVKVDPDSANAKLEDGVLSITFARHQETMPRRIAIS